MSELFIDKKLFTTVNAGGGGSSDTHNKGWFATPEALRTAYPEAENGDYAIVGSTDTVWVWDADTTDWSDSGAGGAVESVNGQTGVVVLDGEDIEASDGESTDTITSLLSTHKTSIDSKITNPSGADDGDFLTTDGTNVSWAAINAMEIIDWEA